jgi:hypothetical protein
LRVSAGFERWRRAWWLARRTAHILWRFPRYLRLVIAAAEAKGLSRQRKYVLAEQKLLQANELLPPGEETPLFFNLDMCLISLRLGNPAAAAELSLKAIRQAKSPTVFLGATAADRHYLRYYGKLIYKEATKLDGVPMVIDVGAQSEADIDLVKVKAHLKHDYPLTVVQPPPAHTLH